MATLPANPSSTGVAIIQSKLKDSVIARLLTQRHITFRTSERLMEGAVVFPKAKVAFLVVEIAKSHSSTQIKDTTVVSRHDDEIDKKFSGIKTRIEKFIGAHSQCVVILKAPLFTPAEFRVLSRLQSTYLHRIVDFLPAHSADDCVNAMLTLVSVQTPPKCDILHDRMCELMNSLLAPPPCLSKLKMHYSTPTLFVQAQDALT